MPLTTTCRGYPYPVDADDIDIPGDVKALAEAVDDDLCGILDGTTELVKLRLSSTSEATHASTGHALQIGNSAGTNLVMDTNEIMARDNGGENTLGLNADGGRVICGEDLQVVSHIFTQDGDVYAGKAGADFGVTGVEMRSAGLIGISQSGSVYGLGAWHLGAADAANSEFVRFGRGPALTEIGSINQLTSTNMNYNAGPSGTFTSTSDYRMKQELGPVEDPVGRLKQLRPIHFRWIANGAEDSGFIAHEVAEVLPTAVTGDKDAVTGPPQVEGDPPEGTIIAQGLDASKLVPLLTAALQQAFARIEALEAQLGTI